MVTVSQLLNCHLLDVCDMQDDVLKEYFYSGRSYTLILKRLRLVHGLKRR